MTDLFEIALFNDSSEAVGRVFCASLDEAKAYAERELKARRSGIYNVMVSNSSPLTFLVGYVTASNSVVWFRDAIILSREQASKLRGGTP